jgi:hypothetical protein
MRDCGLGCGSNAFLAIEPPKTRKGHPNCQQLNCVLSAGVRKGEAASVSR